MIGRIISNSKKHITRSGWIGLASIFVMTLAFLVASVFGIFAFFANLQIQFIEQKSNMLVFFNVGVDKAIIDGLETKWKLDDRISEISFMGEDEAFEFYSEYTAKVAPAQFNVLSRFEEKKLPSSIEIKLKSLDDIDALQRDLQRDIDIQNASLRILNDEQLIDLSLEDQSVEDTTNESDSDTSSQAAIPTDIQTIEDEINIEDVSPTNLEASSREVFYKYSDRANSPPINLVVDSENLNIQKDFFFKARVVGLVTISILFLFIVIFTFMTVEFRLYNQKEEIGVMQLVGGSLFFIRSPYILEGGFYGLVGSLLSSGIIGSFLASIFVFKLDQQTYDYLIDAIIVLPWPQITTLGWTGIVVLLALVGFLIGALSSYFSIRRYIR